MKSPPNPSSSAVWLLWYRITQGDDDNDVILVGAYSSSASAAEAVSRLRTKPGFMENPEIVDDDRSAGFYVISYQLDEDRWEEGFRSETD